MKPFPKFASVSELIQWLKTDGPTSPSVALASAVSLRLQEGLDPSGVPPLSIYFLRTATIEPVKPFLEYHLCRDGFLPSLNFSGYSNSRVLVSTDDGELYTTEPHVIVAFLRLEEMAPSLVCGFGGLSAAEIEREKSQVVGELRQTISAIRSRTKARVLVHTFPLISSPALGISDVTSPTGQNSTIDELNHELRAISSAYPGVHLFDYRLWSARVGLESIVDRRMWLTARVPFSGKVLNSLAMEYVRYVTALVSPRRKCLVVDLDNTLWGGVLGEDGFAGIRLGQDFPGSAFLEFQQAVLDLYHRGIILAVCSKNNEREARNVFEQHPDMILRPHHFASMQINWDDKVTNLRRIAADLSIGLDSLAFADDNPAERSLVQRFLPEVLVIDLPPEPAEYAPVLRSAREFESLSLSPEDRQRGGMYRAQVERKRLQEQSGSLEDYYASLDMRLEFGLADAFTIPRIAQLTQKTNQFNLTTRRYSETELTQMAADQCWQIYWLRLLDRFGDNGITGAAILRWRDREICELDSFLLSCRILGRTVETAFLSFLMREAKDSGAAWIEGWFLPTDRNSPAKSFYDRHGFSRVIEDQNGVLWRAPLDHNTNTIPGWFKLQVRKALCANR